MRLRIAIQRLPLEQSFEQVQSSSLDNLLGGFIEPLQQRSIILQLKVFCNINSQRPPYGSATQSCNLVIAILLQII